MESIIHNWIFVFWVCVVLHLIADFNLQGILADMKQIRWWRSKTANEKYKHDWIAALMCHSFMWSILTFCPLIFLTNGYVFSCIIIFNAGIHACIDVMKANLGWINLTEDQIFHLMQIMVTLCLFSIFI